MQLADRYSTLDLRSLEVVVGNKAGTVFSSPLSEHPARYVRRYATNDVNCHRGATQSENQLASSLWLAGHFQYLLILWKHAILTYYVAKKWSPAGQWYLGSAVALLHFLSHRLPGDRKFRALLYWAELSTTAPNIWTIVLCSCQVGVQAVKILINSRYWKTRS